MVLFSYQTPQSRILSNLPHVCRHAVVLRDHWLHSRFWALLADVADSHWLKASVRICVQFPHMYVIPTLNILLVSPILPVLLNTNCKLQNLTFINLQCCNLRHLLGNFLSKFQSFMKTTYWKKCQDVEYYTKLCWHGFHALCHRRVGEQDTRKPHLSNPMDQVKFRTIDELKWSWGDNIGKAYSS